MPETTDRVDKQVQQQNFDNDGEHADQVGDAMLKDGNAPGGAHVEVEHLGHHEGDLPGS